MASVSILFYKLNIVQWAWARAFTHIPSFKQYVIKAANGDFNRISEDRIFLKDSFPGEMLCYRTSLSFAPEMLINVRIPLRLFPVVQLLNSSERYTLHSVLKAETQHNSDFFSAKLNTFNDVAKYLSSTDSLFENYTPMGIEHRRISKEILKHIRMLNTPVQRDLIKVIKK